MLNTFTVLVPDNENYYIRHLGGCADDIDDQNLLEELLAFCIQEAQDGIGHRVQGVRSLEKPGVDYNAFVGAIDWLNYKLLEPLLPRGIHLANSACIEQTNAYPGNFYLQQNLLKNSDPKMKRLFCWYFAEEIEHQKVAFGVFEHLHGSYFLRVMGAFLVIPLFFVINTGGTLYFLWQDKRLSRSSTRQDC